MSLAKADALNSLTIHTNQQVESHIGETPKMSILISAAGPLHVVGVACACQIWVYIDRVSFISDSGVPCGCAASFRCRRLVCRIVFQWRVRQTQISKLVVPIVLLLRLPSGGPNRCHADYHRSLGRPWNVAKKKKSTRSRLEQNGLHRPPL